MSLQAPIRPPGQDQHEAIIMEVNFCYNNPDYGISFQHQINLCLDPLLNNVVSVFGSDHNDYIVGSHKGNYFLVKEEITWKVEMVKMST